MDLDCQKIKQLDLDSFRDLLEQVLDDRYPPNIDFFKKVVTCALQVYSNENESIRPIDKEGLPGGLLDMRASNDVIIVPDLHARRDFVKNLLAHQPIFEKTLIHMDNDLDEISSECDEESGDCHDELDSTSAEDSQNEFVTTDFSQSQEEVDESGDCNAAFDSDSTENCEQILDDELAEDQFAVEDSVEDEIDGENGDCQAELVSASADNCEQRSRNEFGMTGLGEFEMTGSDEEEQNNQDQEPSDENEDEEKSTVCEDRPFSDLELFQNVCPDDSDLEGGVENYPEEPDPDVLELLDKGLVTVLCLGDGVHSEAAFAQRWFDAYEEFIGSFTESPNMDAEIADSFNLMIAVMLLKIRYSDNFHFLKGNHENICNESGEGNYAFGKFANEGLMVLTYFRRNYDQDLLNLYYEFEKSLPLFAVGRNFLASHAQPETFYDYDDIVNYRDSAEVIYGLTWTDNYVSKVGTIDEMIDYYIPENDEHCYYFGGHRPIKTLYKQIDNNRYVQIHNPSKQIIVRISQDKPIDLDKDIYELNVGEEQNGK